MKLFEYQAKDLFESAGIPVPRRRLVDEGMSVARFLAEVGLPCVLKAQVLEGGRGKAGLIQFAETATEAEDKARRLFASPAKVRKILIEENVRIEKELFMAVTFEPVSGCALVMASREGGMEVEELSRTKPERIIRQRVEVPRGLLPFQAREVAYQLDLGPNEVKPALEILTGLYGLFHRYDAELVEINPLVITREGRLVAVDGKISIDDSALFRQGQFSKTGDYFTSEIEYEAAREGIPYLQFDGAIGLMCAGAGLTNTVYDLIHDYGGSVANYLEFGGPNYKKAVQAMNLTLKSKPKVILIVTFGTIARADVMAQGIAEAITQLKPKVPIVTAIRGTGEEEAEKILRGLGLEPLLDTEQAVKRAVELSKGAIQ